jgi:glucose-6-phosphate isomerase
MSEPATRGDPWAAIEQHDLQNIGALFEAEPDRLSRLTIDVAGIHFDWSKTHLDQPLLEAFDQLAAARDLAGAREKLFSGDPVNVSEGRAATHVAERGQGAPKDVSRAAAHHQRMRSLIDAIEGGAFGDVHGLLHIGIGGSALGPELLLDALGRNLGGYGVSLLSNIDGQAVDDALDPLDPESTLIVAVSKTFATSETLLNLNSALRWLAEAGIDDPYGRVIAITADPDAALRFGIDETRILPFDEGVGGRYSLWSAVGFSAALALGWQAFEELLEGAAEMDRHFRLADPAASAPVLAAFSDLLYRQKLGCQSRAVFPYDERLRLLVPYLQQLEMESNGKSVLGDGCPARRPTAAVTWGGVGTDAQHAVFQLLHQGSDVISVEFIAVAEAEDSQDPAHHRALLLNAFAQGAALMSGDADDDPYRACPGDRPSATILLDRLDPRSLGALIAFYEHRTFTNAALLGINPFDQFGVELGKRLARDLSEPEALERFDPSTRALVARLDG